jgi:hypothetical protein
MLELITFRSDWAFWPWRTGPKRPPPRGRTTPAAVLTAPWRLAKTIRAELAARHAMQTLASLDDRMLRDIASSAARSGTPAAMAARPWRWPPICAPTSTRWA